MDFNLGDVNEAVAAAVPDREAIVHGDRRLTYGELASRTRRLANVYGAGDSGRVIPLWISAARANRDLSVYGGAQVIDFLWVGTAV